MLIQILPWGVLGLLGRKGHLVGVGRKILCIQKMSMLGKY